MAKERILIVEDDPDIVRIVRAYLEREGFEVEAAFDGKSGVEGALSTPPALVVLDWMLPGLDGLEVLRQLRGVLNVPIIMLTARGEAQDRLAGFDHGADDYVPKPFHPPELVARVKAVLRRSQQDRPSEPIQKGSLLIDPVKREVTLAGELVLLSSLEFDLLLTLAGNPGRVFRRDELLDRVWGREFTGVDRVVDVHISNLRQKLERHPACPPLFQTLRGVGYKFTEEDL